MDELERRIRAARPASVDRRTPLTTRAKRELAELILSEPQYPERRHVVRGAMRRRRWARITGSAVVAVLVASLSVVTVIVDQPASARTPNVLTASPLSTSAQDALHDASSTLGEDLDDGLGSSGENSGGVHDGSGTGQATLISVQAWTLSSADDGSTVSSVVTPENYVITTDADGVRTVVVTAGRTTDADGDTVTGDEVPPEGTLQWEESYRTGEYDYVFDAPAPTSSDDLGVYFQQAAGLDQDADAASTIQMITLLLMEQSLSPPQEAALIEYLAGKLGISLAGETTDRLGRQALLFVAPRASEDYSEYLLVSPDTGQILAIETVYTGTGRADIDAPAVVSYYAWNRS